jgi:hypothetical protein
MACRYDLFISYSRPDEPWVAELAGALRAQGVHSFFAPEEMRAGINIPAQLDDAIRSSAGAIVVISESTATSKWVELELALAFVLLTKGLLAPLIPVVRQSASRMPPLIEGLTNIRLPVDATPAHAAAQIVRELRKGPSTPTGARSRSHNLPNVLDSSSPPSPSSPERLASDAVDIDGETLQFLVLPDLHVGLSPAPFTEDQLVRHYGDVQSELMSPVHGLPLTDVTIDDALRLCADLSSRSGRIIRLPTPSEWLIAYRAGTRTTYFFGDSPQRLPQYARFGEDAPARVGTHKPNPWGFYDMAGNVWELCRDPEQGFVIGRGGSYASAAEQCAAGYWIPIPPDSRSNQVGFRLALEGQNRGSQS